MKTDRIFTFVCLSALILLLATSCTKSTEVNDQQFKGWIVGQAASGYGTLLSTTNDGLTWSSQGSQSQAAGVDLYDIHGLDQNTAWAVGGILKGYGLILHTTDGGTTWNRQGTASDVPAARLYAVHAVDQSTIWVAGEGSSLIRSSDGGTTWTKVDLSAYPLSTFYAITSFGNSIWVAGMTTDSLTGEETGMILYSPNSGTTWMRQGEGMLRPGFFSDISAGNDSVVYVSGTNSVFKSTDGGNTWQNVLSFSNRTINGICAVDVQNIWAVGDRDGIFHSTTGGGQWDTINPSLTGYRVMGVTVADVNRIWIVGTPNSGSGTGNILYSRNAGDTWFIENSPVEAGFRRVSFASARR
jgi:photosystem II stability/assembly factor-like uncharacterized protein